MASTILDLPTIYYFESKNKYSGSIDKIFRYKIYPDGNLHCKIWYSEFALDCISEDEIIATADFELTAQGLEQLIEWIENQYMEFLKVHPQQ